MDPLDWSELLLKRGVPGAIALLLLGAVTAIVVLWKAFRSEQRARQKEQREHYEWVINEVGKREENERNVATALTMLSDNFKSVLDALLRRGGKGANHD